MAPVKRIAEIFALHSSLGRSITLFMMLLLITGVVTSILELERSWETAVQKTERSAVNISVSQVRQVEDTFLQVELAIMDINRSLASDMSFPLSSVKYYQILSELVRKLPQLHGLFICDASGNISVSSFCAKPAICKNYDRKYFTYFHDSKYQDLYIGHVIRSSVSGELALSC